MHRLRRKCCNAAAAGWVAEGPTALRTLCFLAATALCVCSVVQLPIDLVGLRLDCVVLDVYLLVCALVLAAAEVKSALCSQYVVKQIVQHAAFLGSVNGRGWALLVVGAIGLGRWHLLQGLADPTAAADGTPAAAPAAVAQTDRLNPFSTSESGFFTGIAGVVRGIAFPRR